MKQAIRGAILLQNDDDMLKFTGKNSVVLNRPATAIHAQQKQTCRKLYCENKTGGSARVQPSSYLGTSDAENDPSCLDGPLEVERFAYGS